MAGGVTTIEIKSGYGLDTAAEIRLLNTEHGIKALAQISQYGVGITGKAVVCMDRLQVKSW